MKNSSSNHICVGIIINTHGIHGELKVEPLTYDLNRFSQLEKLFIGEEKLSVVLERSRHDRRFVYIKLKTYDNINEVLKFKGEKIYIDVIHRLDPPEDHFYNDELLGKKVLDRNNRLLGSVTSIMDNPANPILVIQDLNQREVYVPFVKAFIKSIDEEIIIEPIEGMFE